MQGRQCEAMALPVIRCKGCMTLWATTACSAPRRACRRRRCPRVFPLGRSSASARPMESRANAISRRMTCPGSDARRPLEICRLPPIRLLQLR